jgi:hypothetical protein
VSVGYHLAGLTADVPGDVAPASGTIVFGPGDEEKQVTAQVQGDRSSEPDESFRLVLTSPVASGGRLVLPARSTVATIQDDDGGGAADTIAPTTTATADPRANDAGWNSADVTVTLSATDDEGGSGVKEIAYELAGAQTGHETVAGAHASVKITADGTTTVTYFATDEAGNVETKKTLVVRIDKSAPTVSCTADPGTLWPPNHQLVPISVDVQVDGAASAGGFTLASVTSNEPDDAPGGGDGNTTGDIQAFDLGTTDTAGFLRAEREGSGSGRVYTLTYVGHDRAGNERTCTATVSVPHDRG